MQLHLNVYLPKWQKEEDNEEKVIQDHFAQGDTIDVVEREQSREVDVLNDGQAMPGKAMKLEGRVDGD